MSVVPACSITHAIGLKGIKAKHLTSNYCIGYFLIANRQFDTFLNKDIVFFRGDHIVPNFEEIWPSKKGKDGKTKRPTRGIEYYLDAMENGPDLSGEHCGSSLLKYNANKLILTYDDQTLCEI